MIYLFSFFIIFILTNTSQVRGSFFYSSGSCNYKITHYLIYFFLLLMIGFRHEVGGDWDVYLKIMYDTYDYGFENIFSSSNFGYLLLNWIAVYLDIGIYFVNIVCGFFLLLGLFKFAQKQPFPLIIVLVAFPYLLLVVGMGYTRQSVAIGFVLLAFTYFDEKGIIKYVSFIFVASLFHSSGLLLLPLIVLKIRSIKLLSFFGFLSICLIILIINLPFFKVYWANYISSPSLSSSGALLRLILCFIPAIFYLLLFKKFQLSIFSKRLWFILSIVSLLLFFGYLIFPELSTPIDRLALYLIPLQLMVYSQLPELLRDYGISSFLTILSISILYLSVLLAWVFFPIIQIIGFHIIFIHLV